MLEPFDCHVTVVRNRIEEMEGADEVLDRRTLRRRAGRRRCGVLALPLTADTEGMISRTELEMMERHAWLVNVARGRHIVTDDLVWALQNDIIGGAGLDVTDPEPLPDGHPLWSLPNCIITPHVGATLEMGDPLLAERITANVRLFAPGQAAARALSIPTSGTESWPSSTPPHWSGLLADAIAVASSPPSSSAPHTSTRSSAATGLTSPRWPRRWASWSSQVSWSTVLTAWESAGDTFQQAAREANTRPPSTEFAEVPDDVGKVLRAFVVDGRLLSIPSSPAKRMIVLDWLAQEFEPGR